MPYVSFNMRCVEKKDKAEHYIRPAMLQIIWHGCSATKEISKTKIVATRLLTWKCFKTLLDRTGCKILRSIVRVAPIEYKMRQDRFKWFGHVL